MKVQIIMPCVNLWAKYTRPAIESINTAMMRAQAHQIDTRFLLIDNASTDETKAEAGKMVSSVFAHHRNEERWGFQRSVNFGVKDAVDRGFSVVLVCNNDIVLHPEAIWRLIEAFEKTLKIGDQQLFPGLVSCMDIRGEMTERGLAPIAIDQIAAIDKESVAPSLNPNFSAFAVSRECWEQVGEFDELFHPAYFEDNDYHYRMKLANVDAIVYPPAMFYHYGSRTQNEALPAPIVSGGDFKNNRAAYARKWGGVPGEEKFEHPYDVPERDWKTTKQGLST